MSSSAGFARAPGGGAGGRATSWATAAAVVTAAATIAVLLAGCAAAGPGTSGSPSVSRSPAVELDGANDAEEDLPTLPPPPTWDAESREAAKKAGIRMMRDFARPRLSAQRWWGELEPLLSPAARTAYAGTDPASVPASAVTGPAVLLDDTDGPDAASPWLAHVEVQTDVGRYVVLLSRTGDGSPWLVERLTPPRALWAP